MLKYKNALISVSDKSGLIDFVTPLAKAGMRIVSTGGTAKHLRDAGLAVVDISDQTQFPEILDGRVKTLHPKVHMGLLARQDLAAHREVLKTYEVEPFDLVICNLYPFEESAKKGLSGLDLIEQIDIGGPSMLRSAAKNFQTVTVVCDPEDYPRVLAAHSVAELNRELAAKVFQHTAYYDSLIAQKLYEFLDSQEGSRAIASVPMKLKQTLRYGENPHQQAQWWTEPLAKTGLQHAEILQGKELSYNNLLDIDAALQLVIQFSTPGAVAVKHNNPCGVAVDSIFTTAVTKALKADPVSVFGGVVALNRPVDTAEADLLNSLFLECVVAPDFTASAREILAKKKNLRLLKLKIPEASVANSVQIKTVLGGYLIQDQDQLFSGADAWNYNGHKLSPNLIEDMQFGERVCASLKSNAIAIVRKGQSLGLGMGQVNRVDAVHQAIERMKTHHKDLDGAILISDAFFPFPDSVELIAKAGIEYVLQPGGSLKDAEVLEAAQKNGIKMVLTGRRHFKH